jgi:hypothetical protein
MISQLQKSTCHEFVEQFFSTRNSYSKYDSEKNRPLINERVVSYGVYPSATAIKRACLELLDEGLIQRADGKDATDDAIEEKAAAEDADRRAALATPLTQTDASFYASLSWPDISARCASDRVFRYRYEAACKLWGFRFPSGTLDRSTPVEPSKAAEFAKRIADFESGKISSYQFRLECKNNRELRDSYEAHIGLSQLLES